MDSNPFANLFSSVNDAVSFTSQVQPTAENDNNLSKNKINEISDDVQKESSFENDNIDDLIADVFGITLHNNNDKQNKKKTNCQLIFIDSESIEQAIFERLLIREPELMLGKKNNTVKDVDNHVIQKEIVLYLFESYCRLKKYKTSNDSSISIEDISKIITRDLSTALQAPDLFPDQEIYAQFFSLFTNGGIDGKELSNFVGDIVNCICSENKNSEQDIINLAFSPILDILYKESSTVCNLLIIRQNWFFILQTFAMFEPLAKLVISHNSIKIKIGKDYENTVLGSLLSISCLPKSSNDSYDFFDKPFQLQNSSIENNIWIALDTLSESMHKVFHSLLKCSREVRHLTLQWIGDCLQSNSNRGKLANSDFNNMGIMDHTTASDGFMLNLGNVLLRLCQPFCSKPNDPKLLKIDPTYCSAEAKNEDERRSKGIHLIGVKSETCLVPISEGQTRPLAESFGFVTECFFLTHRALDLGYRVILEKLTKTSQNLGRMQRMYQFAQNDRTPEVREFFTQRMETEMKMFLTLKASLLTPELISILAKFHAATSFWLMQVNVNIIDNRDAEIKSYAPEEFKLITFPLPEKVPDTLSCIPEFVVENTISFLCFLTRWSANVFEEQGPSFLNSILTEIIVLMESPLRLYNPHLRARMAEGLEALLPTSDDATKNSVPSLGTFHRQQLFITHPYRQQIVTSLLTVFVSIEMTGQSVQFEQKFNYRRPMYIVMDYLWKIPEQRNCFKQLAQIAEENMEAVQPPLFLRFINLLMNDAVFLLDDALSNIAQLRQITNARDSGEWNNLNQQERERQELDLQHMGMNARFDNILGRKTIQTLKMLTSEIQSTFCHSTMVDRIASMLNYLLLQLVGPNKKNLKLKDQKEYDFNPANLVLNICEIYINLSQNENFILAISQDGRSYSPKLFKLASDVLIKIGGGNIIGSLEDFSKKVEHAAIKKRADDEILSDAPDEFLDPIMSTLMLDPVILPSSKITVDRQTIARHLLSDQTDPFNRSPLTMDMLKSNEDLKNKIKEWIYEKKKGISEDPSSNE